MHVIADLQLHSRFARAVSPQMTIPNIAAWAARKGIGLVATGDWMHPMWFREIERDLVEMGNGLLQLRSGDEKILDPLLATGLPSRSGDTAKLGKRSSNFLSPFAQKPLFLLATEVSSIYSQGGKVRRVHTLIWVPTIESARKISQEMTKRGCNLMSDGRPIVGLSCIHIAELVLSIEPKALIIPAHAWTPWFSVYGEKGGFESLDEAFGEYAKYIYAIETGLSSNPAMNWRIKELDNRAILSFSDAHSGPKLGREATVFEVPEGGLSYQSIYDAIHAPSLLLANENLDASPVAGVLSPSASAIKASEAAQNFVRSPRRLSSIAYTIEFYPEEGKYHWSGHRACGIRWGPLETSKKGTTCPVCGKPLVQGVVQRVEALAGRSEDALKLVSMRQRVNDSETEITMTKSAAFPNRPPFVSLVPLQEIIHECIGSPVASPKVQGPYTTLTDTLGGEFNVLLNATIEEITKVAGAKIAEGVDKVRRGDLVIDPGYDGVFGVVKLWRDEEDKPLVDASKEQLAIF